MNSKLQNISKFIYDTKGINEKVFLKLENKKREEILQRTLKESFLIFKICNNNINFQNFKKLILSYKKNHIKKLFICNRTNLIEELNHFSRILSPEKILLKNNKIINLDKKNALRETNDFARFLNLAYEIKNLKKEIVPANPFINLRGNLKLLNTQKTGILRKSNDYIDIFILIENEIFPEQTKDLLLIYEKFLDRNTLIVASLLFEYFLFLYKDIKNEKLKYIASVCYKKNKNITFEVFSKKKYFHLFIKETQNINLPFKVKILKNTKDSLFYKKIEKAPTILVIFSSEIEKEIKNKKFEKYLIEKKLNSFNKGKKVILVNNLQKFFKTSNKERVFFIQKPPKNLKEIKELKYNIKNKIKNIIPFFEDLFYDFSILNIEAGHIHADRDLSKIQKLGIKIANEFIKQISQKFPNLKIEKTTMIDEYHVPNKMDYKNFTKTLEKLNYYPEQIIFESSDLIKEIAIDILKFLIKNNKKNIFFRNNNIYLLSENKTLIELVEDYNDNFIIGCVLFDAALYYYRCYKHIAEKIYKKTDKLHYKMLKIYLNYKTPLKRKEKVESLIKSKKYSLDRIIKTLNSTPYIDKFSNTKNNVCLINILEIFYKPQQKKVNKLLSLIGDIRINTLYFDILGNILFDKIQK